MGKALTAADIQAAVNQLKSAAKYTSEFGPIFWGYDRVPDESFHTPSLFEEKREIEIEGMWVMDEFVTNSIGVEKIWSMEEGWLKVDAAMKENLGSSDYLIVDSVPGLPPV